MDGRHATQTAWSLVGWWAHGLAGGRAQELGVCAGWHAAQELGELGARGVWMGGTRLWSRAPAVMHVPGTFNIDAFPQVGSQHVLILAKSYDGGFSANLQAGNNGCDFQYTRNDNFFTCAIKRNRTSAILGCKPLVAVCNPPSPHHPSFSRHWFRRTSQSRVLPVLCFFTGPTLRQRECRHAERGDRCL